MELDTPYSGSNQAKQCEEKVTSAARATLVTNRLLDLFIWILIPNTKIKISVPLQ